MEVKQKPTDVSSRLFLAELCCFAGAYDRAEKQLDVLSQQTTDAAVLIALFRQLLRGEVARHQVLSEGRAPEIVTPMTDAMRLQLEALTAHRSGDSVNAPQLVARIDETAPRAVGTCNNQAFEGVRDLDDRTACVLEVITSTGKYYWTPWESIEYLYFDPPQRALDLLYRRTKISVIGGPEGEVFIPTRYVSPVEATSDELLLGRATQWLGDDGQFVQGVGLRTLLFGDRDMTILELETIDFTH